MFSMKGDHHGAAVREPTLHFRQLQIKTTLSGEHSEWYTGLTAGFAVRNVRSHNKERKSGPAPLTSESGMTHNFFAVLSRMKYIERWALMRNNRTETLSEHTLDVSMIAHALCVIGNVRYGRNLDADRAALIGLYHDASEIITGDMPTPVKYYNRDIRDAYKEVEHVAEKRLLEQLPEDLRAAYSEIFEGAQSEEDRYMRRLVKAADKLSALIKCMEETGAGNGEFRTAQAATLRSVESLAKEMPEVKAFMEEFLPPYGSTLDELLGRV